MELIAILDGCLKEENNSLIVYQNGLAAQGSVGSPCRQADEGNVVFINSLNSFGVARDEKNLWSRFGLSFIAMPGRL